MIPLVQFTQHRQAATVTALILMADARPLLKNVARNSGVRLSIAILCI
jgi:hypothetical protein